MNTSIDNIINTVIEGDCLDKMDLIPDNSIDMILCDLPYGTTQNKWDSIIPLEDFLEIEIKGKNKIFKEDEFFLYCYQKKIPFEDCKKEWKNNCKQGLWSYYNRIIKSNGVIALTSHENFTGKIIMSNLKDFKYKVIWEKSKATNFLNAKKQPLRKHEDICIFYKKQPTYNPQMGVGLPYDKGVRKDNLTGSYGKYKPTHRKSKGERYPTDVVYFKTAESEDEVFHPNQKPVALAQYLIKTYTNEGDIVLDNSCGSGSFLIGAILEKRNFIGIEKKL